DQCPTLGRPFAGETAFETLRLIREAQPEPPSRLRPEIGPELDAVVMRLLARDPGDRYADAGELAAALRPIVHRLHADAAALRDFLAALALLDPPGDAA